MKGAIRAGWRGCATGAVRVLLLAVVAIMASLPARAEQRIALVIGNGTYKSSPLANPKNDAELIANTLTGVGFEVAALIDADQASMRKAMLEFGRRLKASDSIGLFYYAGHGVQVDGVNYLIPTAADITDAEEVALNGVSLDELLKVMERATNRLNIAILDACRDNPFAGTARSGARGLAAVDAPSGTLIAYATAPGKVALDGTGNNSPYTSALAAAIPAEGIALEEVFRRTRRKVLEVTSGKQTPWEHSSLTGEFFFRPKASSPEVTMRDTDGDPARLGLRDAEIRDWERIRAMDDAALFRRHLEHYPDGLFSELAALRLSKLEAKTTPWSWILTGGINPQPSEAEAIFEQAVKLDGPNASTADLEQAIALYLKAADLGLPAALFSLGRAYDKGRGVQRDLGEAAMWYRRAADKDHAAAMASLGTMFEFGEGVELDLAEALRLYRLAADRQDANAMTSLGFLYAGGKGVARDAVEGRRWYGMAVERGQPRAMFNLALMNIHGEGGAVDLAEAARLLRMAADKGHTGALRELASLHDEGRGVARNPRKAAELLMAAYKAGDQQARTDILRRPDTWSLSTRREIQRVLSERGLYSGRVHGFFDQRTRKALEQFATLG